MESGLSGDDAALLILGIGLGMLLEQIYSFDHDPIFLGDNL
jgi:hypothetical protein